MTKQFLLQVELGDGRLLVDETQLCAMLARQAQRVLTVVTDGPVPAIECAVLAEPVVIEHTETGVKLIT